MNVADWLVILSVLFAPLLAVQVQRRLDVLQETRRRRQGLFETLMATRAARLSHRHVEALNMIDIEYYGSHRLGQKWQSRYEKAVCGAWKSYRDHLNTAFDQSQLAAWTRSGDELFTKLLLSIGTGLGYGFDSVELRRGVYSPKAQGDEEAWQHWLRYTIGQLLDGKRSLAVEIRDRNVPDEENEDNAARGDAAKSSAESKSGHG